jgi:hypothetical protein
MEEKQFRRQPIKYATFDVILYFGHFGTREVVYVIFDIDELLTMVKQVI